MATDHELQTVAAAVAAVRPEWPARSVLALLRRDQSLRDRPYRHLVVAAVAIAADPATTTPGRLREHGSWWVAAYVATTDATPAPASPDCPRHDGEPSGRCGRCADESVPSPGLRTLVRPCICGHPLVDHGGDDGDPGCYAVVGEVRSAPTGAWISEGCPCPEFAPRLAASAS